MAKVSRQQTASRAVLAGVSEDLRAPKLSHVVAQRLREQIISGQLQPGSKLPLENDLLEIFKISRPTLREALRILEAESLISIGRGARSGASVLGTNVNKVVEYVTAVMASEGVTLLDLHKARSFFEPAMIRSLGEAPERGVNDAIRKLRNLVDEMERRLAEYDYLRFIDGTQEFHGLLVRSSGNRTLTLLIGVLDVISGQFYSGLLSQNGQDSSAVLHRNIKKTLSGYKVLVDLLEKRKFNEASEFWRRYMDRGMEYLKSTKLGALTVLHSSLRSGVPPRPGR